MVSRSGTRSRARLLLSAVAFTAAAALLQGCDGSNLFEGEVTEEGPELTMVVPNSVVAGEEFDVDITATAPRGIKFIDVQVTGGATLSIRDDDFDGEELGFLSVPVTASSGLGAVTVHAFVEDMNGRRSSTVTRTITVTTGTTGGGDGS